jgi:hypothetical protein
MAPSPPDKSAHRVDGMNPRYRRLVIPGALAGLILIVVLAAVLRG